MKTRLSLFVAIFIFASASMASAYYSVGLTEISPSTVVDVYIQKVNYSGGVYAGYYGVNIYQNWTPANPDTSNPLQYTQGFCVDPAFSPTTITPYYINTAPPASNYSEAAWILSQTIAGKYDPVTAQLAVWTIMFGSGGFALNGSTQSTYASQVSAIVNAASANTDFNTGTAYLLALNPSPNTSQSFGAGTQDYLFYSPTTITVEGDDGTTPIPGTVWLFGAGLAGLIGLKRKYLG